MKKLFKSTSVSFAQAKLKAKIALAILVVIIFSFAACDNGNGDDGPGGGGGSGSGGRFTLTGIPSQFNGKYAGAASTGSGGPLGYEGMSNGFPSSYSRISNGSVSIPLWIINPNATDINNLYIRYFGNETYNQYGVNIYSENLSADLIAGVYFNQVTFSNGSASRSWSQGTAIVDF